MIEPARQYQHYEVLRREDGQPWELGRGAMGVTYKAFDTNLCVEVALKVVNAALLDHPEARERFVREARAAAGIRHRNVASVYHLGQEGERFFYAMEFIDGETLDALVRRTGPLGPRAVLDLLLQVARALGAAARQGLVHRDIKPANLMAVHEDADEQRVIKVIDFGLARPVAGEEGASQLTVGGGFLGTPQYASPEQLEERPLDARSDIYSLGVVAWFLLAGRAPFAGSLATICRQQVSQPPPWEALPVGTPAPLRELLAHMLAKDPAQRPQDAVELGHAIKACLQAVPTAGAEDRAWDRGTQKGSGPSPKSPEPVPGTAPADLTGAVLAGRYEAVQLAAENPDHRVYQARDRWDGERAVAVRTFARGLTDTPEKRARLEDEVRLARAAAHPGLVRLDALEQPPAPQPVFLVEEWVDGFTLRDLLAARGGALAVPDALRLLDPAAQAADHAATCRLGGLGLGLHQVRVHFPSSELGARGIYTARTLLPIPPAEWPEGWAVKVHPLALRPDGAELDTWAGGVTLVPGGPAPAPGGDAPLAVRYRQELAGLVYELLGGHPTHARVAGWNADVSALPALNETANRVLRQAMSAEDRLGSSQEFCHELRAAAGLEADAPPRPLTISLPPVPAAHVLPVRRVAPSTSGTVRRTPQTPRAEAPEARTFLPPDPTPGLADDAPPDGSVWERLNLGADARTRPSRWLAGLAMAGIVFAAAFAAVLGYMLYQPPKTLPAANSPAPAASPRATATPAPRRLADATPAREATPPPLPREKTTPADAPLRAEKVTVPSAAIAGAARPSAAPVPATPHPLLFGAVSPAFTPTPPPTPPEFTNVMLTSEPFGANVSLHDGTSLGTTPITIKLKPGKHQFRVQYKDNPTTLEEIVVYPNRALQICKFWAKVDGFDPMPPEKTHPSAPAASRLPRFNRPAVTATIPPSPPIIIPPFTRLNLHSPSPTSEIHALQAVAPTPAAEIRPAQPVAPSPMPTLAPEVRPALPATPEPTVAPEPKEIRSALPVGEPGPTPPPAAAPQPFLNPPSHPDDPSAATPPPAVPND